MVVDQNVWLPIAMLVLGTALGAGLSFAQQWALADRAESRRRTERRADFELRLLDELEQTLFALLRAARALQHHSTAYWERTGRPWHEDVEASGSHSFLEAANEAATLATLRGAVIGDPDLTNALDAMWESGYQPFMKAATAAAELAHYREFQAAATAVAACLGRLRRERFPER